MILRQHLNPVSSNLGSDPFSTKILESRQIHAHSLTLSLHDNKPTNAIQSQTKNKPQRLIESRPDTTALLRSNEQPGLYSYCHSRNPGKRLQEKYAYLKQKYKFLKQRYESLLKLKPQRTNKQSNNSKNNNNSSVGETRFASNPVSDYRLDRVKSTGILQRHAHPDRVTKSRMDRLQTQWNTHQVPTEVSRQDNLKLQLQLISDKYCSLLQQNVKLKQRLEHVTSNQDRKKLKKMSIIIQENKQLKEELKRLTTDYGVVSDQLKQQRLTNLDLQKQLLKLKDKFSKNKNKTESKASRSPKQPY